MRKPYRLIYALHFTLEGGSSLVVSLNRLGQADHVRSRERRQGMPHPPKRRTVDLRVGDKLMYRDGWRKILAERAVRDDWLTAAEARACKADGYIYRPRKPR